LTGKRRLVAAGVATVAFFVVLTAIDPSVRHAGRPSIFDFELAASRHHAAEILGEWGAQGRATARLSLWLDYGFMVSYGAFFTLAGLATRDLARARRWRRLAAVGAVVPFLAVGAAMFDAAENVALLLTLGGHGGSVGPPLATACSSVKWAAVTIAALYAIVGLGAWIRMRDGPRRATV
jgi:hypothetical protein